MMLTVAPLVAEEEKITFPPELQLSGEMVPKDKNGMVRLLRFNGSYINSISSVSGRVEGKIVGKALETINNRFQVAYVVRSPTEISVTANSNQFEQTGKLKRQ